MTPDAIDVPPDAIQPVEDYLLSLDEVVDIIDDRVSTKQSGAPQLPYLTLQQFNASLRGRRLYVVNLQFDAYGTDRAEASLLARTVFAAMLAIRNVVIGDVVLTGASEELGPGWQPDTARSSSPTARYVFGVAVTVHTDPTAVPVS